MLPCRPQWCYRDAADSERRATKARLDAERMAAKLASIQALQARGHGTLCFYGPPGTGKTALAEHIATTLAQPLHVRQASDLMGKYVGETEQNMAAMFREAETENAILLLDEADSFLLDRGAPSAATRCPRSMKCCRAWSVSMAFSSAPPI
mgnify:CR=1 FL=1